MTVRLIILPEGITYIELFFFSLLYHVHTYAYTHTSCIYIYICTHTHPLSSHVVVEFHFVNLLQTMDEVVGVVQICVRLVAGILTNPVTVTLRFASGSATGKY